MINDSQVTKIPTAEEIQQAQQLEETSQICQKFEDLDLKLSLLQGIFGHGFEMPSEIQQRAIIPFLQNQDMTIQAQSGSGKTGCFVIGILQIINESIQTNQAIIIAPTNELSIQIYKEFKEIGKQMKVKIELFIGGTSYDTDIKKLKAHPQILIGNPNKIKYFMQNQLLDQDIKYLVFDEADQLLQAPRGSNAEDSYQESIKFILSYISKETKIALFSATFSKDCLELRKNFMPSNSYELLLNPKEIPLKGITQYQVQLEKADHKLSVLINIIECIQACFGIIFCNSQDRSIMIMEELLKNKIQCAAFNGKMLKDERYEILNKFKQGQINYLITTDLLGRGIDVQQVNLIINYDIPYDACSYIHRIGRSGRYGRRGASINLVTPKDEKQMKFIQKLYQIEFTDLPEDLADFLQ